MSVRVTCPSCDASMSVSEEKRGQKVRCKECDKFIPVPDSKGKKNRDDEAIQDSRKVAAKAVASSRRRRDEDDDDDDYDDRPTEGRKGKPAKKGFPVLLVAGGGCGALLLLSLVAVGGLAGLFLFGSAPRDDAIANVKFVDNPNPENNVFNIDNGVPDPVENPPVVDPLPPKKLPPIVDPNAGKPLPDAITPEVPRVKRSTVYLRVTMPSGQVAEGSGFFVMEPGVVVTNAHVLGMLQASSKPPRQVEVTLNSGLPDQMKLIGKVVGVDRSSDLAVVRVPNNGKLPPPLFLETERPLIETQPVFIFGFPLGAQLGANITVSNSSVSSLRTHPTTGILKEIQVNGGMHPGNSGGPVVNSLGNVVGVAVAVIRGTQINFAIPAGNVRQIMEGRFDEANMGEPFLAGNQPRLPMKYTCLDPLNRVSAMRVEVWTGRFGAERPTSMQKPSSKAGDSVHVTHVVNYRDGTGQLDVPLPPLPAGQVYWLQPVITTAKGTQWGTAIPTPTGMIPLERKPANLLVNHSNVKERTVKVKSINETTIILGKTKEGRQTRIEVDFVEFLGADPKGAVMKTAINNVAVKVENNGQPMGGIDATLGQRLKELPPVFIVDGTNKLQIRTDRNPDPKWAPALRNQIQKYYWQMCNALESVTLPMPNRTMQPKETWPTKVPMMLRTTVSGPQPKPEVVDLDITCTYEGTRTKNQRPEAFVSFVGRVMGRGGNANFLAGHVTGKLAFDVNGGFIAQAILKIHSESEIPGMTFIDSFDIELTRSPGNASNLTVPPEPKKTDPGAQAKAKVILNHVGALQLNDPLVNHALLRQKNARMKVHEINMAAGREYVIALNSNAFDSYLILESPTGQKLAEDDDGGGFPNAHISYRAEQTGLHRVVVTAFDGQTGPYQLTVQEWGGTTETPKGNDPPPVKKGGGPMPKGKPVDFVPKTFKKPATSAAPKSYFKIVSTPGDSIGQGKSYNFPGNQIMTKKTDRGLNISVSGWTLEVGARAGQFLQPGEYLGAKRYAFSGNAPGLDFFGQGRVNNTLAGEFVVWELEMNGDQVVRLAIDFVQRSEGKGQPLNGKVRINSTFQ